VYRSLELIATRDAQRVQLMASYTRQWRDLEGTWQANDPAAFIQPSAFANDRGIGAVSGSAASNADANSLSGTSMGPGGNFPWQDQLARIAAAVSGPWRSQVAVNYSFQSGPWSGPIVTRIAAADSRFGPPTVVLSNGRVVSNPLATTIRFAHPTRADGQFHAPALQSLNLRVGVMVPVGRTRLDAGIEVLNVQNRNDDVFIRSDANQQYSSNFRLFEGRQTPRVALLSVRARF
jgi:hypothetical protein